jgi:hypothetical protein
MDEVHVYNRLRREERTRLYRHWCEKASKMSWRFQVAWERDHKDRPYPVLLKYIFSVGWLEYDRLPPWEG